MARVVQLLNIVGEGCCQGIYSLGYGETFEPLPHSTRIWRQSALDQVKGCVKRALLDRVMPILRLFALGRVIRDGVGVSEVDSIFGGVDIQMHVGALFLASSSLPLVHVRSDRL